MSQSQPGLMLSSLVSRGGTRASLPQSRDNSPGQGTMPRPILKREGQHEATSDLDYGPNPGPPYRNTRCAVKDGLLQAKRGFLYRDLRTREVRRQALPVREREWQGRRRPDLFGARRVFL